MKNQWFVPALAFAVALPAVAGPYEGWNHAGVMHILTTPEGAELSEGAVVENFPLLVRLDRDWFDFSRSAAGGEDIRFSANGIPLAYQIDTWDPVHGTASLWVRVPVTPLTRAG